MNLRKKNTYFNFNWMHECKLKTNNKKKHLNNSSVSKKFDNNNKFKRTNILIFINDI